MAGKCPISITKDGNVANFSAIFSVYDIMALNISGIRYLDFAIDRFFVKLFKTNNIHNYRKTLPNTIWIPTIKCHHTET